MNKSVLILDDEPTHASSLEDAFGFESVDPRSPFNFEVSVAKSKQECFKILTRNEQFDALVIDLSLDGTDDTSGLEVSFSFVLHGQLGLDAPIRVFFTGHANVDRCVQAMRYGAWDFISKGPGAEQKVVNSIVAKLRQNEIEKAQEEILFNSWIPTEIDGILREYAGQVIAIWHEPEPHIITFAEEMLSLEMELKEWRSRHAAWQAPYVLRVPKQ